MTKISVIIPIFNGEKYLEEAIESVLKQTFKDFELVVIDDGSTDRTSELLSNIKDKRMRVIRNSKNLGVAKSLNIGLKEAGGEYIARADADDVSLTDRFAKQVNFLDSHPDYVLVSSNVDLIDDKGKTTGHSNLPLTNKEIRKKILVRNPIAHPTVMFKKSVLEKTGGYRNIFNGAEDYDLWFRMLKVGKLHNLPERLVKRRIHANVVTKNHGLQSKTEQTALLVRLVNLPGYLIMGAYYRD